MSKQHTNGEREKKRAKIRWLKHIILALFFQPAERITLLNTSTPENIIFPFFKHQNTKLLIKYMSMIRIHPKGAFIPERGRMHAIPLQRRTVLHVE
jgi:hypothetical protein